MGLMPEPTPIGADCLLCFDAGKTPSSVKCFFGGIERGQNWQVLDGLPPNGYWILFNSPEFPCIWTNTQPAWPIVTFILQDGVSTLGCKPRRFRTAFSGRIFKNCQYHFTNLLQGWPGNAFYGGDGSIAVAGTSSGGGGTPPINLAKIITDITPMIDPNPRMECFPMDSIHTNIRYAGKRDATNIMIKVDTTFLF